MLMTIQVDSREKERAIKQIVKYFDENSIEHFTSKLYVGDYCNLDNPKVIIDRKQNLIEVSSNLCQDHDRFRAELIRAMDAGIHLIILVEHGDGIDSAEDVIFWDNPRLRLSPKAMTGERLYNTMQTVSRKYGCEWRFCDKEHTGEEIVRLLS